MEPHNERLASLDVFRGLTIAGMILVNNPGTWNHVYPPLRHADWHGCTPTDLIFPFFLFIVGVAMTFSFAKRMERGAAGGEVYRHVVRRAVILFGLGLLLNGFPLLIEFVKTGAFKDPLRIPGVLQRIAVCYLLGSLIVLNLRPRLIAVTAAVLLLAYWLAMALHGSMDHKGQNLAAVVDRAVFGRHVWKWGQAPGPDGTLMSHMYDPEGLLSTLPALCTVLIGALAGSWLRLPTKPPHEKASGLFAFGWIGTVLGLLWDPWFPINKPIWTSSYVMYTGGLACVFLAFCYWLIDLQGFRPIGSPFQVFGVNPIVSFVGSSLAAQMFVYAIRVENLSLKTWLFKQVFEPIAPNSPRFTSLLYALCYMLLWLGLMTILYRKRIVIKV